jgi:hypothetical protein
MAKPVHINPNADLPPLMVLSPYLKEKKREFVTQKLHDFGLVRKEIFNRKLGHQRKDFPFKPWFKKRYRYVTAPMTDEEVDQLASTIQSLMSFTPKVESSQTQVIPPQSLGDAVSKKSFSILSLGLILFSLISLGGGFFLAYQIYLSSFSLAFELASLIAAGSLFVAIMFVALAEILKLIKSKG